ncbi:MAG: plasmid mobilization relaxosome protein MobC [Methylotenera sp.]|nr:plasmid mobilization relaxosome protein MobC [Methylotenera sp.]MDP2100849.1 plasmid mobilization relaxosome protein MobC [Methylotenera sp.]MDP2403852.1 plasmid mobilization relaxosome protein MobC [Methylotenera sp.]MDP3094997.1 plasmid mobilization relaxosome protein MobC [Methylotenera sp.]MDP3206323.1 plasmid mobilization relaxosome protein MobC [Methylotenera sp.]
MTNKLTAGSVRVRRTHTIKLRVTDAELATLRDISADTAIAVFIREKLFGDEIVTTKQHRRKKPMRNGQDAGCAALARQVAMIGSNLNQLARAANMSVKENKPINLVIVAITLLGLWKELHVLQSVQSGTRQGCGDRLFNEPERREWSDADTSSKAHARKYGSDEKVNS